MAITRYTATDLLDSNGRQPLPANTEIRVYTGSNRARLFTDITGTTVAEAHGITYTTTPGTALFYADNTYGPFGLFTRAGAHLTDVS